MTRASDYAVVYDITSNRERSRVDKLLKGFGFRVQKSVFECRLTRAGRNDLIRRLEALEVKTGFIKIYRLDFTFRRGAIGAPPASDPDGGAAFIV